MFGWNKKVSNRLSNLVELQAETISLAQLKQILYDSYEVFSIWGQTEGRTKPRRTIRGEQMYSVAGPNGYAMGGRRASNKPGPRYWTNMFVPEGYVILYNVSKGGFRTYPINRITEIEKDGQRFKVK
jgi:hypothetical protein